MSVEANYNKAKEQKGVNQRWYCFLSIWSNNYLDDSIFIVLKPIDYKLVEVLTGRNTINQRFILTVKMDGAPIKEMMKYEWRYT